MQFIDTHIHLQDYKSKSAPQILREAGQFGVKKFVCAAVVEADWDKIAVLAEEFPQQIIPAFGLHPWYIGQALPGWEERLAGFLSRFPAALVGETGLDKLKGIAAPLQEQFFLEHIRLAGEFDRPLIIHAVKAAEWLEKFWQLLPSKFVLHSFSGRPGFLKRAIGQGAYVSFCKKVLQNRDFAELAKSVPSGRLLLESDGPYQSEPQDIPELAAAVATIRNETQEALSRQVYQNSEEFLNAGH